MSTIKSPFYNDFNEIFSARQLKYPLPLILTENNNIYYLKLLRALNF